jgi:hypothetical protein
METVYSGDFIQHDVSRGNTRCNVMDILVHTDPGQEQPLIIIADGKNYELRSYDLTSWQCLSQCTTPTRPRCLYESDGYVYLYCGSAWDGSLYDIVSVRPLAISTSPYGHVTRVDYYDCISHLGPGRLVATCFDPSAVHVINLNGLQLTDLTNITDLTEITDLTDLTRCREYSFSGLKGVVCGGGRVVVAGEGGGSFLGREWKHSRNCVVCIEESAGAWSVQWMYDVVHGYPIMPVIMPGGCTVIVTCRGPPDRIVSLFLETGAVVQQVDVAPGCPGLSWGTCVYGGSLLVGCYDAGVVVEFSLQGKMVCYNIVVVVVVVSLK